MTLFWFELSKADRERTDAWLRALRGEEAFDSLGLADLLEHLSDRLYPGTVTGMTRARYLLIVPAIYKYIARHPDNDPFQQSKRLQARFAKQIGTREKGNLGVRAGEDLSRFPSSLYWSVLRQLQILRRDDVTERQYLDAVKDGTRHELRDDDGVEHRERTAPETWWAPEARCELGIRDGRFTNATLELTREERRFLRERYLDRAKHSFLAYCIGTNARLGDVGPWQTRVRAALHPWMGHAQAFRAILRIANLLYAFFVTERRLARLRLDAEAKASDEEARATTKEALERCLREHRRRLAEWDPGSFLVRLGLHGDRSGRQERFLEALRAEISAATDAADLIRRTRARIVEREAEVRPGKRRLGDQPHGDLLRQWERREDPDLLYEPSSRHNVARRIVEDLREGTR